MLREVGPCVAVSIMCICWQMLLMRLLMLQLCDVKPTNLVIMAGIEETYTNGNARNASSVFVTCGPTSLNFASDDDASLAASAAA